MFNLKVCLIIALVLFVLTSAILNMYTSYSMANSVDFKFKSNTYADNDYVTVDTKDNRRDAVSATAFWSTNKYLVIAPPILNVVAGLMGAYLLMF